MSFDDAGREARFPLVPCDDAFFDDPPFHWTFEDEVAGSPARVFDVLTRAELERFWFPKFKDSRWRGVPGAGVKRDYHLTYMHIVEHFVVFEPGVRLRFYVTSSSLPLLHRFGETYDLTPAGPGRSRLRWQIAYEPHRAMRWAHPVLRPLFASDFRAAMRQLCAFLARDAGAAGGGERA